VTIEFCLPAVAEPDAEGFVVNWFKDEGQPVKKGELLLEVQFEKVTTAIEAPQDGVLTKILTPQGEPVRVGQPLCLIADAAADSGAVAGPAPGAAAPAGVASPPASADAPRATPAARRLARELGVDIAQVKGSGPAGRISEEDVRRFAAAPKATAAPAPLSIAGGREPLSPAQRVVGERMLASLRESAQFTLGREVEVTALVALRARLKKAASPITLGDLLHRAVVIALGRHPHMQAQLEGGEPQRLRLPDGVDLGFAVARDRELLVPVIRGAHALDLAGLAAERARLTEAVRSGTASALELQGGTFTVTSLGGYGIDFFTPILNPPQPAILGVGRTVERLVMRNRTIEPAHFLTLSLTVDHRVINGADGAAFLATLADLVAAPEGWALGG
jgi:pyruvate dehydrogenase E2 component (dihydrolipoamide acetyltransferase)